ncbi:MAG: hypothetical protein ACRBF0_19430 [Calditrichia bacterium]
MHVNMQTIQKQFRILGILLLTGGIWFSYAAGLWREYSTGVVVWLPWVLAIMLVFCGVALLLRNAKQRALLLAASMLIAAFTGFWGALLAPPESLVVGGLVDGSTHQVFAVRMICGGSAVVALAAFFLSIHLGQRAPARSSDFA